MRRVCYAYQIKEKKDYKQNFKCITFYFSIYDKSYASNYSGKGRIFQKNRR